MEHPPFNGIHSFILLELNGLPLLCFTSENVEKMGLIWFDNSLKLTRFEKPIPEISCNLNPGKSWTEEILMLSNDNLFKIKSC